MGRPHCHTPLVSVASNFHFMRCTSANSKLLFNPHQHGTKATPIFRSQLDVNYTQNYIHPKGCLAQMFLSSPLVVIPNLTLENWIQVIRGLQMLYYISHFHWSCDMAYVSIRQTLKRFNFV